MKEQDIDKLFRDALSDLETKPRADIWNKISAELDQEDKIVPLVPKRNLNWLKYAAACLVVGFGVVYYTLQNQNLPLDQETLVKVDEKKAVSPVSSHEKIDETPTAVDMIETPTSVVATIHKDRVVTKNSVSAQPEIEKFKEDNLEISEEDNLNVLVLPEMKSMVTANIDVPAKDIPMVSVTEIDPVKPIIDYYEEEETMLASAVQKATSKFLNNIVNSNENVLKIAGKEVKITSDEERSISVDINSLFARTKFKKRK